MHAREPPHVSKHYCTQYKKTTAGVSGRLIRHCDSLSRLGVQKPRTPCRTHSHPLAHTSIFVPLTLFNHTILAKHIHTRLHAHNSKRKGEEASTCSQTPLHEGWLCKDREERERNPRWLEFQATTPHQLGVGEGREGISFFFFLRSPREERGKPCNR